MKAQHLLVFATIVLHMLAVCAMNQLEINEDCNLERCAPLLIICLETCTCDFKTCECCPSCRYCLGYSLTGCCQCVLSAEYCNATMATIKYVY